MQYLQFLVLINLMPWILDKWTVGALVKPSWSEESTVPTCFTYLCQKDNQDIWPRKTAQMLPPWKQDVLKSFQLDVVSDKEVYNIVALFWAVYKHWTPRNQGLQYSLTILLGATFVSHFIFPLILTPHFRCCLTGRQVPAINNLMI